MTEREMIGDIDIETFDKTLEQLCSISHMIAASKGFVPGSIGESVALFHSECSALLEDARAGHEPTAAWYETREVTSQDVGVTATAEKVVLVETVTTTRYWEPGPGRKPCGIPSEIADIIIRLAHFAGHHQINLGEAIRLKLEYNSSRSPMHGGKKF